MKQLIPRRMDDMLDNYGDKFVAAAEYDALKRCDTLSDYEREAARHEGECRACVVHDSFFMWDRPLSNSFDELRDYGCESDEFALRTVRNWQQLRDYLLGKATHMLMLHQPMRPAFPVFFPSDLETKWWTLMAIIHQCYRELREII